MKVKRIKKIKINSREFNVKWINKYGGAGFSYSEPEIYFCTKGRQESEILMMVCHELQEICAVDMSVRLNRPDCDSDYIFVYDHRQHDTMMEMFSTALASFL